MLYTNPTKGQVKSSQIPEQFTIARDARAGIWRLYLKDDGQIELIVIYEVIARVSVSRLLLSHSAFR